MMGTKTPEVEDPEMRKMMAVWERMERRFWWQLSWIMAGLAIGIALSAIIVILLVGFYLFMQMD